MTQELKDAQRDLNYTSILSPRWYISGEEGLRTYGSGLEFRKLDSFLAYPEPHRIDIIAHYAHKEILHLSESLKRREPYRLYVLPILLDQ